MIVFITRYLDLLKVIVQPSRLGNFLTLYNTIMKILYISLTAYIVYLMKYKQPYKATYDKTLDTFRIFEFAILPCASLALFVRRHTDSFFFDVFESPSFLIRVVHLDLLHLLGSHLHYASTHYSSEIQRDWESHVQLRFPAWSLSLLLHSELDCSLYYWGWISELDCLD